MTPTQLVWFKRDLRVHDHAALHRAARRGPVLPLFILEDEQLFHPEFAAHHYRHLCACLAELRADLARLGAPLLLRRGEAVAVLDGLRRELEDGGAPLAALWAHQETGNAVSYARDQRVRAWARAVGLPFFEPPQNGVVRRLQGRDTWAERWEQRMAAPLLPAPAALRPALLDAAPGPLPTAAELGLAPSGQTPHPAGERAARQTLEDFLERRALGYQRHISSPLSAEAGSSRLSAHLAFGSVSLRTVVQANRARRAAWEEEGGPEAAHWARSLRAFGSRLHWHCHFMQRLESEPELEWRELHPAFAGLRDDPGRDPEAAERLAAWQQGRTGYPMVDACMRSLLHTGWLNFRMRAMLVSFAAYHLWLPWQVTGLHLARQWIDNEPGIHWPQMQMQSGAAGINRLRVYSPVKQAREQDPEGEFIRRWVPELAHLPVAALAAPWRAGGPLLAVQADYPAPVVPESAGAQARARVERLRESPEFAEAALAVYTEHGSRLKSRWGHRSPAKLSARPPATLSVRRRTMTPETGLFGDLSPKGEARPEPIRVPGLPQSWQTALEREFAAPYFHALKDFLIEERRRAEVYPPAPDVFSALRLTPLEDVKVLILGQDPYHGPGQAHGLSFSVRPGVTVPPSLRNIYRELQDDLGLTPPRHGFLEAWARQGVLLLNAVLTVRRKEPNSHAGQGWEGFTDAVIRAVNDREERVVFVLWGAYARKKRALITGPQHVILESAHPSPFSADRFFGTRPFSRANAALVEAGRGEVDWSLPEQP